jgi:5'-methylthioadenosine phosphorylase
LKKPKIAIIGGTGFKSFFKDAKERSVKTRYGKASPMYIGKTGAREVVFLCRHGPNHSVPPHKINYRANLYALYEMSVERVIAINAVGAINRDFKPGDIVVPHDFIDFTKFRDATFYDGTPVTHVDVSQPYCPEIRRLLIANAKKAGLRVWDRAVLVCTEGPRFETPAEIEMFRRLGCDVVSMTSLPEAVLARELEICYAAFCFVSNMAAGFQEMLTPFEVSKVCARIMPRLEQALIETVKALPIRRKGSCPCVNALRDARIK